MVKRLHKHSASSLRFWVKNNFASICAGILPAYMVPARFVILDSVPLNQNGKVDRKALPSPAQRHRPKSAGAPRSELENRIAAVWARTLGSDQVELEQNFFDAGGDSLMAVELHQALRRELAQPVEVVDIFRYPTVRALAARLGERTDAPLDLRDIQRRVERRQAAQRPEEAGTGGT